LTANDRRASEKDEQVKGVLENGFNSDLLMAHSSLILQTYMKMERKILHSKKGYGG